MNTPRQFKILVLEDDANFRDNYKREEAHFNLTKGGLSLKLVFVTSVDEAAIALVENHFDGAIIDLRLSGNDETAEGNKVAEKIYESLFVPMAVVSGFPDELSDKLKELDEKENALFRFFNKNESLSTVFAFFINADSSGVLAIFGPGGELNKQLGEIFWNHIGPSIKRWQTSGKSKEQVPRLLRHLAMHLLSSLQARNADWDDYELDEVYINPPMRSFVTTGDIFRLKNDDASHYFLITPACDVIKVLKTEERGMHLLKIVSANQAGSRGKLEGIVKKTNLRYHALPKTDFFSGGLIDFWHIETVTKEELSSNYTPLCSVIEPFAKDIAARFGGAFSRQGSPNLDPQAVVNGLS